MSGYTRQSVADIIASAVIKAAPVNAEFNALRDAFEAGTGHRHDGDTGEGGFIPLIADLDGNNKVVVDTSNNRISVYVEVGGSPVEQLRIQDGVIVPVTDDDIDLGTASLEFKDLYIDGIAKVDTLTVDENATIAGTLGVTGNTTFTGNLTVNGNTTIGDADTDTVTVTADVASPLIPSADDTYDLGAVGSEWRNLYVDGTANIDSLIADTADINGGTIDGTAIGGSTPAAGAFTTISASGTATLSGNTTVGGTLGVTSAATLSGALTVAGTATLNGNTIIGNAATDTVTVTADVASNLIPSADNTYDLGASGSEWKDLYIDGTANIDSLVADTADINGGTIDGATIGGASAAAGTFTDLTSSGTSTHATVDINGGNIDGTIIGAASVAAITGTTVTATTNFVGDITGDVTGNVTGNVSGNLTGDVTGNVTGNVSGNVTGNVTGDLTGNVTATTGTSSFAAVSTSGNVTIGGDLTVNGTTTTISTTNTVVEDALIELGNGTTGSPTNDAGIVIERGDEANAFIGFDESADKFTVGTGSFTGASTGDLTITTGTLVANIEGNVTGDLTGNADTATALETPRTIAGQSFDGTANISIAPTDLTGVTATANEINIIDGDTGATATTLVDTDTVIVNDAGTIKQVALSDFETFFESALDTLSNVTTVGALNAGSITSGFGSIDVGADAISTTGTVTFGTLSDGVINISSFVDEDDMASDSATLVPTQQSVKAYVDTVAGSANNVVGLTATGAELNVLDGDTTPVSVTLVGTDGFPVNDAGTTKLALVSDISTYIQGETVSFTNATLTTPTVSGLYLSDSGFVVEGSSADANETTVTFANPTADRTITFPDATGTVFLTGSTDLAVIDGGTGASDAATARTNLGLTIGTNVQAWDVNLDQLAGLAVTDGNFIVGNGSAWVAESGSTARTSLGLGSIATENSNSVSITGGSITGITDLAVADGGTGASSFTANNVLLGNDTSAFQVVAPGTSGNVLTSNGTTWESAALSAPAPTTDQVLTATAGASAGAVGTYTFARTNDFSDVAIGATTAGSNLLPTSAAYRISTPGSPGNKEAAFLTAAARAGTWRCMAQQDSEGSGELGWRGASLFLRIS
jgi:hypothetical protein